MRQVLWALASDNHARLQAECYGIQRGVTTTKADLAVFVATRCDLTQTEAADCIALLLQSIIEALHDEDKVELRGFGSFQVRERGAHRVSNPKTGESVMVPEKRIPYFKQGKILKEGLLSDHEQQG